MKVILDPRRAQVGAEWLKQREQRIRAEEREAVLEEAYAMNRELKDRIEDDRRAREAREQCIRNQEREACAKVADAHSFEFGFEVAAAIRARGKREEGKR